VSMPLIPSMSVAMYIFVTVPAPAASERKQVHD